mgnify:CR=1 FL=1
MLYDVGVTRNLCGHVLIEADSADEAEKSKRLISGRLSVHARI